VGTKGGLTLRDRQHRRGEARSSPITVCSNLSAALAHAERRKNGGGGSPGFASHVDPKNAIADLLSVVPAVKCRLSLHQIRHPGVAVPLNPVIDHAVPSLGRFGTVHENHCPSPSFVNDLREVPYEKLNPVRREARSHDEKDVRAKRLVMSHNGGDRLSSRVLFIVEHDIGSKLPDCGCSFPSFHSAVGYLGTAWARRFWIRKSLHLIPAKSTRTVGASKTMKRSMKKNTFDSSAVVMELSLVADLVNAF